MAFGDITLRPEFAVTEAAQAPPAERRRRAAAAAAGTAGAVAAAKGASTAGGEMASATKRAAAATKILAALVAFLDQQRRRTRTFVTRQLAERAPGAPADAIEALMVEEERRQQVFERKARERVSRDVTVALAIADPEKRQAALRGITAREQRWAQDRATAVTARAVGALDRVVLREESPTGAFWQLDPNVKQHTAGCLFMGGRFWPWQVLDRVHPPRHAGCPCRLRGYTAAVAEGRLNPARVMDVGRAVQLAAGVVMEGALLLDDPMDELELIEEGERCAREELRSALMEQGMADGPALAAVFEAFDRDQPRYPKGHPRAGQWRPKLATLGTPQQRAGFARRVANLHTATAPREIGTTDRGNGPEPVVRTPNSPEELRAIGKRVADLADTYGAHHAYRERINALHAEKQAMSDALWQRMEEAGGYSALWDQEKAAAEREGRPADSFGMVDRFRAPGAKERGRAIDAEVSKLLVEEERGRRDALAGALATIRPMGGRLRTGTVEGDGERATLERSLSEASRLVPTAWIEDSNRKGVIDYELSDERAFHLARETGSSAQEASVDELLRRGYVFHGYVGIGRQSYPVLRPAEGAGLHAVYPSGAASRLDDGEAALAVAGPRRAPEANSHIRVKADDPSTLLHELAHRFEQFHGEENRMSGQRPIITATTRFLRERAGGEQTKRLMDLVPGSGYREDERTWEDAFVEPYVGKDYAGRATEVLTMGMQFLFYPTSGRRFDPSEGAVRRGLAKSDLPMRDFVLGLVATL